MAERVHAQILCIKDINESTFFKVDEEFKPSYIETSRGDKASRVNIIGVAVAASNKGNYNVITIDDGTGNISLRDFEKKFEIAVGSIVTVIGKPRSFNNEIYVLPEIIKKIENKKWAELRKLELKKKYCMPAAVNNESKTDERKTDESNCKEIKMYAAAGNPGQQDKMVIEEEIVDDQKIEMEKKDRPAEAVIKSIRCLDKGSGADIEEVISVAGPKSEEVINALIKDGEIFEVRPGRIKVLD